MTENPRKFEATDPFGRQWNVSLRWLQNAISIRHADAVDVKWDMSASDGTQIEKVIALRHPDLLEVSRKQNRELSDSWCIRLAAAHLQKMIETWEDAEPTIVTPSIDELQTYAKNLESEAVAAR